MLYCACLISPAYSLSYQSLSWAANLQMQMKSKLMHWKKELLCLVSARIQPKRQPSCPCNTHKAADSSLILCAQLSLWHSNTALSIEVLAASPPLRMITDSVIRYLWINSERWGDKTSWLTILILLLSCSQTGQPETEKTGSCVALLLLSYEMLQPLKRAAVCVCV